jgi:hypothetical protein
MILDARCSERIAYSGQRIGYRTGDIIIRLEYLNTPQDTLRWKQYQIA